METSTYVKIGIGVAIYLVGLVWSIRKVRAFREKARAEGREVPKGNPALSGAMLLIILTVVGVVFGPQVLQAQTEARLEKEGAKATAKITDLEETGTVYNERPEVEVTLQVMPAGEAPFEVRVDRVFSIMDIQRYQVGAMVEVLYDPADHDAVSIRGVAR